MRFTIAAVLTGIVIAPMSAYAIDVSDLSRCARISASTDRLNCYDAMSKPAPAGGSVDFTPMSLIDFKTDKAQLKGRRIEVKGFIMPFSEMAILMTEVGDMSGVFVDIASAPRDDRRKLASCTNMCKVTVRGVAGKTIMQDGIISSRLIFE